ncbi:hypothetical protein BKA67DRAFT_158148 [Truncatella angustata]|uniref:C2H2-type domain-containing protein n=1 Tax=Truncatella angustata TaxID=152316 RepID=A0A9P9A0Z4_9PEZI|nr:uncharacterized protein BKA67DRAFT_158148 [Truncatella angustata]KAH6656495.1 hypothetical protein BKA67DRAFT_158148 [Truncatella angustata]
MPPLPSLAAYGPFECPFCFMMISASNTLAWKKHVYADLRPYICFEPTCRNGNHQYGRRHEWMEHVIKNHWRTWKCSICLSEPFSSATALKSHITQQHTPSVPSSQLDVYVEDGKNPKPLDSPAQCPLCNDMPANADAYQRHVGRHQEELALFSLPNLETDEKSNHNAEFVSDCSASATSVDAEIPGKHVGANYQSIDRYFFDELRAEKLLLFDQRSPRELLESFEWDCTRPQ